LCYVGNVILFVYEKSRAFNQKLYVTKSHTFFSK
jgi:hypothetical protein